MGNQTEFEKEVAAIVVETLNLEMEPEEIDPEQPLMEDGLGLDSIDLLEMSMELSRRYNVELNINQAEQNVFNSLRNLVQYIEKNKH